MIRPHLPASTPADALENLVQAQRALKLMGLRHRRERASATTQRDLALSRAADRHIPVHELAAAVALSESRIKALLKRVRTND